MARLLNATAKDLHERARRPVDDHRPLRPARALMASLLRRSRVQRGWADDSPSDVDLADFPPFLDPHDVGQAWQKLVEPLLQQAFAAAGKGATKFSAAQVPTVTQLFTPPFVAEWLIRGAMPDPLTRAIDLRLLDPACGTMHFGLAAIDALRQRYRAEIDRAGRPGWPSEPSVTREADIDHAILRHNLFGNDLDPFMLDLAHHALELKLNRRLDRALLNLTCADALRSSPFGKGFDIVVTNPPYLSARNVSPALAKQWKRRYPLACRDAYACFIQRCLQLVKPGSRVGMLSMHSFMFTGSYEPLRRWIADHAAIEQLVHFGPGLFDTGNPGTLQTVAFVLRKEPDAQRRAAQIIRATRLTKDADKQLTLRRSLPIELAQAELMSSPRAAWTYWLSPRERAIFATCRKLGQVAAPRQGLATTDNARFVRHWWEVAPLAASPTCFPTPGRWTPYVKAGQSRRWHESPRHVVNWQDDGREIKRAIVAKYPYLKGKWEWVAKNAAFYGRSGVTYSYLTSGRFSARQLPAGAIFDVAGSSLFPNDPLGALAVLNSSAGRQLLAAVAPTVNFQVGDLAELPLPDSLPDAARGLVSRAIALQRRLDESHETAPDFTGTLLDAKTWTALHAELALIERDLDELVAGAYGLSIAPEPIAPPPFDPEDADRRALSLAIGQAMRDRPYAEFGDVARSVDCPPGVLHDWVDWQNRLYRSRPRWWAFGDRRRAVLIAHDQADRATLAAAVEPLKIPFPPTWHRHPDDGIAVNLAPLSPWLTDRKLRKILQALTADPKSLAWSQTHGHNS